jgi:hypothetical protein
MKEPRYATQPQIEDVVYVPSDFYIGHGADDFRGGRAHVTKIEEGISGGEKTIFIGIGERPNTLYNWGILSEKQKELAQKFGDQIAHPDPDFDPQFNNDV